MSILFPRLLDGIVKPVTAVRYVVAPDKRDVRFLGRFTWDPLLDFEGLARALTVLTRGYLFHHLDGSLTDDPRSRIEYARRALCAWCSVPGVRGAALKKDRQFLIDFRGLHDEFPALVDENGGAGSGGTFAGWRRSIGSSRASQKSTLYCQTL